MKHNIEYDAANHRYYCNGRELISVTTLLKTIVPPFDEDTIAERVAKRDGKTKAQVLAEWKAKGDVSTTKGSDVHTYAERQIRGDIDLVLDAMNYPHLEERKLPPEKRKIKNEYTAFDRALASFRDKLGAKVVLLEQIVGDPELGVAGRVDVVFDVVPGDGVRRRCLVDWKTGGRFETNSQWGCLLPPFQFEPNCELARYSIQLSLYRLLLEREYPEVPYSESYIVHLRKDGDYLTHRALDYRERVLAWLKGRVQA